MGLHVKIEVSYMYLHLFKDILHKIEISKFRAKTSMHNQVGLQGWFPQNIERYTAKMLLE